MRFAWAATALFLVGGATWLVSMIWKTSELELAPSFAPHVVAALISGLTLARVLDRRRTAITLAAGATFVWLALQLLSMELHDTVPRWAHPFEGSALAHYALLAAVCIPVAGAAASLRLVGRPDHRLLWLWISALLVLGIIIVSLTLITKDTHVPPAGVILILLGPIVTGALAQVLAPRRMIWTCGGGALIFVLIMFDKGFRQGDSDGIAGPLLGMGMFVLLGALGARIGWRLFRNKDPRTTPKLPTATAT